MFEVRKKYYRNIQNFNNDYGGSIMPCVFVFWWHSYFSSGWELFDDKQRKPNKTIVNENIVTYVLNKHQRMGCRLMDGLTGIPKTVFRRIIRNDLGKRKYV